MKNIMMTLSFVVLVAGAVRAEAIAELREAKRELEHRSYPEVTVPGQPLAAQATAAPAPVPVGFKPFKCDEDYRRYKTGFFHAHVDKGNVVVRLRGNFGPGPDIQGLGRAVFFNFPYEVEVVLPADRCGVDPNEPRRLDCQGDAKVFLVGRPGGGSREIDAPVRVRLGSESGIQKWLGELIVVAPSFIAVERVDFDPALCVVK